MGDEMDEATEGPPMNSWRTTLCGVIGICAGAIVVADFGPMITKLAGCLAMMANGCTGLFARDERAARRKWVEIQKGETSVVIDRRKPTTDL